MIKKQRRRMSSEINAGSMADIAFLLLIFFLVTTTMDMDTGLRRVLPPWEDEPNPDPIEINDRNVFEVLANAQNQLLVEQELMDVRNLREAAKQFIANPEGKEELPERIWITKEEALKKVREYKGILAGKPKNADKIKEEWVKWDRRLAAAELIGDYFESKQVISLQNDRGTGYDLYVQVQNELAAAYNELRDDLAMSKFGRPYAEISKEKKKAVKAVYPQKISEAEPADVNVGN